MQRRHVLASGLLLAASFFTPFSAHAQISTLAEAINKAGRLRMLSQRMAKAYFQIALDADTAHSRHILDDSMALFERLLGELKAYVREGEERETLLSMDAAWKEDRSLLIGKTPNRRDGQAILEISSTLLSRAEHLTTLLEKRAGNAQGQLVNLAGRQRMLSQRMAKLFQARLYGISSPNDEAALAADRAAFVRAMATLRSAPANTERIREELALADTQWLFFDTAIQEKQDKRSVRQFSTWVAGASERILEQMDRVATLYQQLP